MQNQFSYQLVLMSLAISTFVIGSTEFITVGLLPLISSDLGISIPLAGLTVSIYALGVTIGGPIITSLFSHFPKKKLVLGILSILILGNLLSGLSGSFTTLLLSRIVTSFSHGIFMAVGTVIATDIVPENKKASSIAIMFSGLTISTIIGVPLGTFIGDSFGWRITFFFITGIGILALLLNTLFFPSSLPSEKKLQLSSIKGVLASKKTLGALLITVLGYGATFVPFTYLSPILKEFGGFSSSTISWILMGYGIMIALGNIIGGKLSNSKPIQSLFWMFIANAILLLVFYFTMLSYSPFFLLLVVFGMGFLAFISVPGLQIYAMSQSKNISKESSMMLSSLNISSFNLGIFLGSYIGQLTVAHISLQATGLVGTGILIISSIVTFYLWKNEKIAV